MLKQVSNKQPLGTLLSAELQRPKLAELKKYTINIQFITGMHVHR